MRTDRELLRLVHDFLANVGAASPDELFAEAAALDALIVEQLSERRWRCDDDDFVGTEIGTYETFEGRLGRTLQLDGKRVVHVYGERRLIPLRGPYDEPAAQASATPSQSA